MFLRILDLAFNNTECCKFENGYRGLGDNIRYKVFKQYRKRIQFALWALLVSTRHGTFRARAKQKINHSNVPLVDKEQI